MLFIHYSYPNCQNQVYLNRHKGTPVFAFHSISEFRSPFVCILFGCSVAMVTRSSMVIYAIPVWSLKYMVIVAGDTFTEFCTTMHNIFTSKCEEWITIISFTLFFHGLDIDYYHLTTFLWMVKMSDFIDFYPVYKHIFFTTLWYCTVHITVKAEIFVGWNFCFLFLILEWLKFSFLAIFS